MDNTTLLIAVAVLLVLVAGWYFMYYKKSVSDTTMTKATPIPGKGKSKYM